MNRDEVIAELLRMYEASLNGQKEYTDLGLREAASRFHVESSTLGRVIALVRSMEPGPSKADIRSLIARAGWWEGLHEHAKEQWDHYKAQVERMRPVVEAAVGWVKAHEAYEHGVSIDGGEAREREIHDADETLHFRVTQYQERQAAKEEA